MKDEGYVKYQCNHKKAEWNTQELKLNLEIESKVNELDRLRTSLFDVNFIGIYRNGIGFGNVSIKYPNLKNDECFIISATGTGGARELGLEGYCLVTKTDILNNTVHCQGPLAASSESMSHAAIYQASNITDCIVHIHHKKLFTNLTEQENMIRTPKNVAYGTVEMAEHLGEIAKNNPLGACVLMEGHEDGIIFYGTSIIQVQNQISFCLAILD